MSVRQLRPGNASPAALRAAAASFATGVTIITTCDESGAQFGLTANSFASVSLDPPLVLFCVAHKATTRPVLRSTRGFVVNVLSADQRDIATRFARSTTDKFTGVQWRVGHVGMPLIDGCIAHLECETAQYVEAGDHDIVLGRVVNTVVRNGEPLLFHRSRFVEQRPLAG